VRCLATYGLRDVSRPIIPPVTINLGRRLNHGIVWRQWPGWAKLGWLTVLFSPNDPGQKPDEEDHADELDKRLGDHDQCGQGQRFGQGEGEREHDQ
jgi:hypothetical protein